MIKKKVLILGQVLLLLLFVGLCKATSNTSDIRGFKISVATLTHSNYNKNRRIALVIGNADYKHSSVRKLNNPEHDAKDMSALLKSAGFEVITLINADLIDMKKAVKNFVRKLNKQSSGIFYYAGHGVEISKINYLIPVDAKIDKKVGLNQNNALNIQFILDEIKKAGNILNIIILDACRNNPFSAAGRGFDGGFRGAYSGFSTLEPPTGSLLAYATAPKHVALDGAGRNGTYTKHLLKTLKIRGLIIEDVFKKVRIEVKKETNNKQIPWEYTSLSTDFFIWDPYFSNKELFIAKDTPIGEILIDINNENTKSDFTENKASIRYHLKQEASPFIINKNTGIITLNKSLRSITEKYIELSVVSSIPDQQYLDVVTIKININTNINKNTKNIYLSLDVDNDNYSLNQLKRFLRKTGFKIVTDKKRATYQLKATLKVMVGDNILGSILKPISIDLDMDIFDQLGDNIYSFNSAKKVIPHINAHEAAKGLINTALKQAINELGNEKIFSMQ